MPWPAIEFNKKMFDISQHQGDVDFVKLKDENPDIEVIVHRLANVYFVKDAKFDANYQAAKDAGFKSAAYGNVNPSRQAETHWEKWMPQLENRRPKFFMFDCETSAGMDKTTISKCVRNVWKIGETMHTWHMAYYTAAWWWNPHVNHGWEDDHPFVIAHWPSTIPSGSGWRVPYNYTESDPLLPIGNNFTPYLPQGVSPEMTIAWQFSSSGRFDGILPQRVDMNYMKKWFYDKVWTDEVPPVGGCPDLAPKLRGETVALNNSAKVMDDEADVLREQASRIEGYADEAEG